MPNPDQKRAMYHEIEEVLTAGSSLCTGELLRIASKHGIPVSIDAIAKSVRTGTLEHILGRLLRTTRYKKRTIVSLEEIPPEQIDFSRSKSIIDAACARPKPRI
jgi:hypothetical protein